MTQETMQAQVMARAMKDLRFRQELLNDPRAVLAREYQLHLPEQMVVQVLEETPTTCTLVLSAREQGVVELTEAELQAVSGGGGGAGSLGGEW